MIYPGAGNCDSQSGSAVVYFLIILQVTETVRDHGTDTGSGLGASERYPAGQGLYVPQPCAHRRIGL